MAARRCRVNLARVDFVIFGLAHCGNRNCENRNGLNPHGNFVGILYRRRYLRSAIGKSDGRSRPRSVP
jgi:hypothetical protein